MAEYIERGDVWSEIDYPDVDFSDEFAVEVDDICEIPAADVAPVVHGRWKGEGMGDYSCSLCTEIVNGNDYHYCPNCGAHMKDGE